MKMHPWFFDIAVVAQVLNPPYRRRFVDVECGGRVRGDQGERRHRFGCPPTQPRWLIRETKGLQKMEFGSRLVTFGHM